MDDTASILSAVVWPMVVVVLLIVFHGEVARSVRGLARRVERGDDVRLGWLTLGRSVGKIQAPPSDGAVTDDHLALVHRSWRVKERDADFENNPEMYQIHIVLFGEPDALERVDHVTYKLDPAWPDPIRRKANYLDNFELYELANGYSLIRAEVTIKGQDEVIYLSRFIDLMKRSPKLQDSLLAGR